MEKDPGEILDPDGNVSLDDIKEVLNDPDLREAGEDVLPGWSWIRRGYRLAKLALSREYRQEIRKLKAREDALIRAAKEQAEVIALLRRYIRELEAKLEATQKPKA